MVRVASGKDLRLVFETPESPRMDDAVAVPLEVIAIGMRRFRDPPPSRIFDFHRVACEHGASLSADAGAFQCKQKAPPQRCLNVGRSEVTACPGCLLLGQLYLGRLQLFLHLRDILGIHFRWNRMAPLIERPLPLGCGEL